MKKVNIDLIPWINTSCVMLAGKPGCFIICTAISLRSEGSFTKVRCMNNSVTQKKAVTTALMRMLLRSEGLQGLLLMMPLFKKIKLLII